MKSCLKTSPPPSPELNAPPTPSGSGWSSPQPPHSQKTVSFCSEECLEEVFIADEWDRTPAPVTPRLSYQDVLELKQLRLALPRTPPSPSLRQPFTTSLPDAYAPGLSGCSNPSTSPSNASFPVSRFASQPSQTPSRWKNRNPPTVDPDILPYLDAVPIRLLPLLDALQPTSECASDPAPAPGLTCASEPSPSLSQPLSVAAPPSPQPPPSQISPALRIPTPSPDTKQSASPSDSPTTPTSVLPAPRLTSKFVFLPLLPVDPAPCVPAPTPTPASTHTPKRSFYMTFVPLAAPVERTGEPLPVQDVSSDACIAASDIHVASPPSPTPTARVPLSLTLPSALSLASPQMSSTAPTPLLSPCSTDADADTDSTADLDTDTESDAPSTSTAESIPSPPEPADAIPFPSVEDGYFAYALQELRLGTDEGQDAALGLEFEGDAGEGEGKRRTPAPGPGQTPPLSALYPSPRSQAQQLRAISSAALVPPSPFSLGAPTMMSKRMWGRRIKGEGQEQDALEEMDTLDDEGVLPPSITRRPRGSDVTVRA